MTRWKCLSAVLAGLLLCLFTPVAAAPAPCSIRINLPALRLYLSREGEIIHDYPIAVGKPSTQTPVGAFTIVSRVHNPTWYPPGRKPVPPGPANPLGQWWLGLSAKGYGIHGCLNESSIGQPVSKGCIRMHNRDVAQLVQFVGVGTTVMIAYEPFAVREDPDAGLLWLWVGNDIYGRTTAVTSALAYLRATASLSWQEPAQRMLLAKGPAYGWHEVPRPVEVFVRERYLCLAYQWQGPIWLPRAEARRLPGGEGLADGAGDVGLEELAAATAAAGVWRYNPFTRALTYLPARLRMGEAVREGAVRLVQGRIMVKADVLADLLGQPLATISADPGLLARPASGEVRATWYELKHDAHAGWRWRWSEDTGEVVVEEEVKMPFDLTPDPL